MTSDHPVRRLLARICSPGTMSRIVDPTLADMRVEGNALRGYVALGCALTLHIVGSIPATARHAWSDDEHAVPRVMLWSAGVGGLAVLLLVSAPMSRIVHGSAPVWRMLVFVSQALVVTIPAGLLIAIPLALRGLQPSARLIRRIVVASVLYAGLTFGTVSWVVPAAHRAVRVAASGNSDMPPPGLSETSLSGVRREIARLRTFHGSDSVVRYIEYEYEVRLSLSAAAVPLALFALAATFSPLGRRHPGAIGIAGLVLYLAAFPFYATLVQAILRSTTLPPGSLAWAPNAALVFIAGILAAIAVGNRQSAGGTHRSSVTGVSR